MRALGAVVAVAAAGAAALLAWCSGRATGGCALGHARALAGSAEGDAAFDDAVRGYWQRGYGTTCAVIVNAVLSRCGVRDEHLNRGRTFRPGNHVAPLVAAARAAGALKAKPTLADLRPGDIYYIDLDGDPARWHVGFVEEARPGALVTIDGGQTRGGRQAVARVTRPVIGGALVGPAPLRTLRWAIDTAQLIGAERGRA